VIRQFQRRCNELESSLTLVSIDPTVTPDLQRHLDLHWALLRQVHEELGSTPGAAALAEAEIPRPRFHDLFVELLHNKSHSTSQKLHILQSSLRNEARNVLTDTAFSQGGYDDTWLRLKARYQNGKILVFAAIAKTVDYKPIDGSSRPLRALHNTIKNLMSTLKNLDVSTKSCNSQRRELYDLSPRTTSS